MAAEAGAPEAKAREPSVESYFTTVNGADSAIC
jgi:hypothetical protein